MDITKNMLKDSMSNEVIAKYTCFPQDIINEICSATYNKQNIF